MFLAAMGVAEGAGVGEGGELLMMAVAEGAMGVAEGAGVGEGGELLMMGTGRVLAGVSSGGPKTKHFFCR